MIEDELFGGKNENKNAPTMRPHASRGVPSWYPWPRRRAALLFIPAFILVLAAEVTAVGSRPQHLRIAPSTCAGWSNAQQALKIDEGERSGSSSFSSRNSALVERKNDAASDQSALSSQSPRVRCQDFRVLRQTLDDEVTAARLVFSLAAEGSVAGEDVVIFSYSVDDGQRWTGLDSFVVQGHINNASHGGYWEYDLPATMNKDDLARLLVSVEYVKGEAAGGGRLLLDGVRLDLETRKIDRGIARLDVGGLSFLTKRFFLPVEDPIVYLDAGDLESLEILDASGKRVDLPYLTKTEDLEGGGRLRIELKNRRQIRPGTYTVKLKTKKGRVVIEETQKFSWGVLVMNTPKSTYEKGETVPIAIGALNREGKTICSADLMLRVRKPDGGELLARTSDGTITGSSECGPESITAHPDYLYRFKADSAGMYALTLTAETSEGPQTVESTVSVLEQPGFTIERVGPSRINPKQPYLMHLFITPEEDFEGALTESVPATFAVSEISNGGRVASVDSETATISWDVAWKKGAEYELTYVFDAPDVSPAVFTVGPSRYADHDEGRVWQVASDEVVVKEKADLTYQSIAPSNDDWNVARPTLVEPTKPLYKKDETVAVEEWKKGFILSPPAGDPLFSSGSRLTITAFDILAPTGGSLPFDSAEEFFTKDGTEREVKYLLPNESFRPGTYTIRATITDGIRTAVRETAFEWGTLDLSFSSPSVKVKGKFAIDVTNLDRSGVPDCTETVSVEVKRPDGDQDRFSTEDGSLARSACGVEDRPQASLDYRAVTDGTFEVIVSRTRHGATRVLVARFQVNPRPPTPSDVRTAIEGALSEEKDTFSVSELPSLNVKVEERVSRGFAKTKAVTREVAGVSVVDPRGRPVPASFTKEMIKNDRETSERLSLDTSRFPQAGRYTVTVDIEQGDYLESVEQDFTWGVLAMNVRRSYALPDSDTDVGMTALDDNGTTLCNATLQLELTNPNDERQTFSTEAGTIVRNPACADKSVTNDYDYTATFRTSGTGRYTMKLTATTKNGTRSITDSFEVSNTVPFDVERTAFPTRIYPRASYDHALTIVPRRDYRGVVRETFPTPITPSSITNGGQPFVGDGGRAGIEWSVDWQAGERYSLGYTTGFPIVSPAFYRFGPLEIGSFHEARQWQVASDAVNITVSGILYSNEGTTAIDCNAANKTVKIEVNNTASYSGTCTLAAGTYSIANVSVNGSDVLTIYISGATEKGSRTTRVAATPADITGANIYQNRAIVSHEDTGPITNTNLDQWDSGNDSDVLYSVTSGALTVASGRKLIVWTGKTFTPGGSVATTAASTASNPDGDLDIQSSATLSMGTNALSVGGDFVNSGTLLKSSGQTTTFTATGTGFGITMGTGNFDGVTFNGTGGEWTPTNAVNIDVTLTMTAGTLKGTQNITVNANVAGTAGVINLTGGTFKQRVSTTRNFGTTSGSVAWTFYNFTLSNSGSGISNVNVQTGGTGDITIAGVLTLGEAGDSFATGLMAGNRTYYMTATGTTYSINAGGTFFSQTSTFVYNGSPSTVTVAPFTYNNLTIGANDANSVTYANSSSMSVAGTATVSTGDTWNCNSTCSIGSSSTGAGTLVIDGTIGGSSYLQYYSNTAFPTGGTVNIAVWMNGSATGNQTLSARTYGGGVQLLCWCAETITLASGTIQINGNLAVAENTNGVNYTVDAATNDPTVNVTVSLDFNGNSGTTGIEILNAGAGTWTVGGSVDFRDSGSQAGQYNPETNNLLKMNGTSKTILTSGNALYNFEVSAGSTTSSDALTVNNNFTISGGTYTAQSSGTLTVGGTFSNSATFTHNSSTVVLNGASGGIAGSTNTTFNNLTISGTVTVTASNPTVATLLTVDTSKSLTINSGLTVTLSRNNASDSLTLNGTINGPGRLTYQNATANSFTTNGTLASSLIVRFDTVNGNLNVPARTDYGAIEAFGSSANARTVTLGTAGSQTITTSSYLYVIANASSPNNVTIQGATYDPTLNVGGDLDFTGTGSASEIVTAPDAAANWSVAGNVDFTAGTYTKSAETLILNGTAQQTLTTNSQALNSLTLNNTGTDGTANDDIVVSGTLDVDGTFTMTDGQLRLDTNNPNVTTSGNVSIGANGSVTKGTGTWTFDGTTAKTYTDSSSAVQNIGAVTFNKTDTVSPGTNNKITLASSMTADTVTIDGTSGQADTLDLGSSGYTLTLANAGATSTVLTISGTLTIGTSTIKYTATNSGGNVTVNALSYSSLNLGPSSAETYDIAANQSTSGTVTVDTNATMSIASGILFTHSGSTLTLNGTISGAGTYVYQSSTAFPTGGAISSRLRMDATNNAQTLSARTYGGLVEIYNNNSTTNRTVTMGTGASQTLTFSNALNLLAANNGDIFLDGGTNNPTVSVSSDLDFTGTGNGTEVLAMGDGTWTVTGNVDFTSGVAGPQMANLSPVWDNTAQQYYQLLFGCIDSSTTYSCIGTTTNPVGSEFNGLYCDIDGDEIYYWKRIGIEYDPTGINDSAAILQVQMTPYVGTAMTGSNANFGIASADDLSSLSCTSAAGVFSKLGGVGGYLANTNILSTTGTKIIDLGSTAATDVQSRITGSTARYSVAINANDYTTVTGELNSDTASSNPTILRVAYVVNTTGTLTMNGSSKNLTTAGNHLYNLNLSGTITLVDNLTVDGNLDLTGGNVTPGSTTVTMAGAGKTLTAPAAGDTLYNLTIDPLSAGTVTLAAGGGELTVSNVLNVASSDTLSIGSGRTLTLSLTSGSSLTLSGTISGSGRLTYSTTTSFPTGGTLSSILRFDASSGNQTMSARTYGGQVEIYNNSSTTARTVTMSSGTHTLSSNLYLIADNTQNITLAGNTNNPTVSITTDLDYTGTGSGSEVINSGTGTWTVGGKVDFTSGTYTATSGNTIKMTGTANLISNNQTLSNLTIDGTNNTVTVATNNLTVSGTITIGGAADGNNDTLSLSSNVTSGTSGTVTFVNSGTDSITGSGTLSILNSNLDTDGTLSAPVVFNAANGNITMPARTYSGVVTIYNDSLSARTVTMGAGTHTLSSDLNLDCACDIGGGGITLAGNTNNPTVNVTGNVSGYVYFGGELQAINMGSGTWTVSGSFDLSTINTFNHNDGKLVMAGAGTLTTNGKTLNNLDINSSGTVTLAAATHTMAGNLLLGGSGTPTVTGSTVLMNGTGGKTIDGGGKTLNSLTIDPTSAATITLQNTDLTVSGTLTVATGDTLSFNASRTLSATGTTTLNGTISGSGTLRFTDTSAGPAATGTLSSVVRYDATNGNIASTTLDARTYGGRVEFYSSSTTARTVTFASGTYTTSGSTSHLYVIADGASPGNLTLTGATNNPTVTIGGALDFTGTGTSSEIITSGTGTWTVGGSVNFSDGTYTATSGNTVTLNGASQQTVTSASQSFYDLTVTNSSGSDPDASPSVVFADAMTTANTFTAATANVKLRFNAGSTYTFDDINFNGQATGTRVFLRSSTPGTQWTINAGTGSRTVSYTSIKDSNACGSSGGSIDASDGTNVDAANNSCWTINAISISISDTSIGFGSCSPSAATYATGTNGSSSDTADAHTITVSANAANGYSLTVTGATLTSGGNTITAIGGSAAASSPGSEQFGMRAIKNSGTGTVSSPYDTANWAYAGASSASQIASHTSSAGSTVYGLRYICNIGTATEAGDYSATLTYILSASF